MKARIRRIDFKSINPGKTELTVEKLRELTNRPNMPENEAKEMILIIKVFVGIIIKHQASKDQNKEDTDNLNIAA